MSLELCWLQSCCLVPWLSKMSTDRAFHRRLYADPIFSKYLSKSSRMESSPACKQQYENRSGNTQTIWLKVFTLDGSYRCCCFPSFLIKDYWSEGVVKIRRKEFKWDLRVFSSFLNSMLSKQKGLQFWSPFCLNAFTTKSLCIRLTMSSFFPLMWNFNLHSKSH